MKILPVSGTGMGTLPCLSVSVLPNLDRSIKMNTHRGVFGSLPVSTGKANVFTWRFCEAARYCDYFGRWHGAKSFSVCPTFSPLEISASTVYLAPKFCQHILSSVYYVCVYFRRNFTSNIGYKFDIYELENCRRGLGAPLRVLPITHAQHCIHSPITEASVVTWSIMLACKPRQFLVITATANPVTQRNKYMM
jgi:hypothetical protein